MDHLDDNAASEFVSGSLSPAALTKVEHHLSKCRECRTLVAALAADAGEDSNAQTVPHERESPSQVAQRPRKVLTGGDLVGRFIVLSTLGAGGMGVVHAAHDPHLDRKVALKLLRGPTASSKDARARLRREAQAIAQLSHPNVVSVYDVGTTDDGDLYIAMEFIEGDTLTAWLKRWPRTWREIVEVFDQAARGLVAAHSVGLLHRDFKPDNVLVGGDGRVRVTDFGLARSVVTPESAAEVIATRVDPLSGSLSASLTATGTVLGTPRYMPPEQLTGPDIDARSDQFSFCVALYEALYGAHPLKDGTSAAMLERGDKAAPIPEGTRVPAALGRAVLRGLERDRAKRFPSMSALMAELAPPPERHPWRYAAVGLGAVLVAGVAIAGAMSRPAPPPQAADGRGVQPFVDEINKLHDEINALDRERRQLLKRVEQHVVDERELDTLKQLVAAKDEKIQELITTVARLQTTTAAKVLAKPLPPSQGFLAVGAVESAQAAVAGCFSEWSEREPSETEATVVVRLTVTPDGFGHSATVSGPDSEILKLCVSEQIAAVKFPAGADQLDLEVNALWSNGQVYLSPRVIGRHEGPKTSLDLD